MSEIVRCARGYLGVKWQHQGRTRFGIDCAGLVICAVKDAGIKSVLISGYSRHPDGETLMSGCRQHMRRIPIDEAADGDVYLMTFESDPQHLAIKTDIGIIHSYASARRVVEHGMDDTWRRRIVAAFRVE